MAMTTDRSTNQTGTTEHGGIPRWARMASLAMRLVAVGPLLMLAAGLIWGMDLGDDGVFFLISAALPIAGSFLVRARRTWVQIVGIVLAVLGGLAVFWTVFGLGVPASFFDFVPGVLVLPGVITAIVCGIGAIRAQRRGDLVTAADGGERRGISIVVGVVGVLAALSLVLTVTGRDTVGDDVDADAEVALCDFEFDEETYTFAAGDTVVVTNDDPFIHTFTVDALDIDVDLGPGSEKVVEIPADAAADTYVLYCEPHTGDKEDPGEDDMAAVLTVD